jgi:NodT family efflux transporter outer membrane factor (OMF) lipoprotein
MKPPKCRLKLLAAIAPLALLSACAVGPDYKRPDVEQPAAFKEAAGWKMAQPRDEEIRGNWWEAYNDPLLNQLQEQASTANLSLAQAEAAYRQALAAVQGARAAYFPTVGAEFDVTRSSSATVRNNQVTTNTSTSGARTNHSLSLNASWEPDLWGRVRRSVEASSSSAQASAADLQNVRLSMQTALAQDYFQLRALDSQQQLLDRTLRDYERSLKLTQNQYEAGVVARANVVQAQTQLKNAQTQALDIGVQRAQLEHAIALLVGKAPASFSIAPSPLSANVPDIPVALPSSLLERRPDIAAAERRVAAANAEIGVAKAAYFPSLGLSANGGYQSNTMSNLLSLPNRFWSIGPSLALTLLDGGARRAQTDQAIAAYDQNVAIYRQTVLTGFQEVEDNLAALRILEQEAQTQDEAVQLARQSVAIATNQYKAGVVSYLEVITAQTTALNSEINAVNILNRRLAASVLLIKALGGGWHVPGADAPGVETTDATPLALDEPSGGHDEHR